VWEVKLIRKVFNIKTESRVIRKGIGCPNIYSGVVRQYRRSCGGATEVAFVLVNDSEVNGKAVGNQVVIPN
jgi:hypothetical protein